MIDAAIVGLGWWGRYIVESQQGGGAVSFIRGCDLDPVGTADFADAMGLRVTVEFADVLGDPEVQAIILTTPHAYHADQVVQAARAGKHVFVEKPLALNRADAERAVAACAKAGVALGIGHERRFEPALIEIKRMVEDGELGTIMHAEANFSHDSMSTLDPGNWRLSPEHAPAAGMTAMGVHLTDSLIGMLGPVEHVYAETARRVMQAPGGDVVSAHLRFESGVTGYINSIMATPLFMRLQVFGSDAWVEARDRVRPEAEGVVQFTVCRAGAEPETREIASIDAARANIEAFARAAAGGPPYPIPLDDMIHNVAVLEAIVQSCQTGSACRIP